LNSCSLHPRHKTLGTQTTCYQRWRREWRWVLPNLSRNYCSFPSQLIYTGRHLVPLCVKYVNNQKLWTQYHMYEVDTSPFLRLLNFFVLNAFDLQAGQIPTIRCSPHCQQTIVWMVIVSIIVIFSKYLISVLIHNNSFTITTWLSGSDHGRTLRSLTLKRSPFSKSDKCKSKVL